MIDGGEWIEFEQLRHTRPDRIDVGPVPLPPEVADPEARGGIHDLDDLARTARFKKALSPPKDLLDADTQLVVGIAAIRQVISELCEHACDPTQVRTRNRRWLQVLQVVLDEVPVGLHHKCERLHRRSATVGPGTDADASVQEDPQRLGHRVVGEQLRAHGAPPPAPPH